MIVKLIIIRFYLLISTVLLFLNYLGAQEKPSPLKGIDLRIISMHYDWANLARYEDKNKEVVINQNEDRVVFIGNSITEGWKNLMPTMFDNQNFINRGNKFLESISVPKNAKILCLLNLSQAPCPHRIFQIMEFHLHINFLFLLKLEEILK